MIWSNLNHTCIFYYILCRQIPLILTVVPNVPLKDLICNMCIPPPHTLYIENPQQCVFSVGLMINKRCSSTHCLWLTARCLALFLWRQFLNRTPNICALCGVCWGFFSQAMYSCLSDEVWGGFVMFPWQVRCSSRCSIQQNTEKCRKCSPVMIFARHLGEAYIAAL